MTIIKQLVFFTIMSIYVFADTCSYDSGRCRHDINFQYFNDNLLSSVDFKLKSLAFCPKLQIGVLVSDILISIT